MSTLPEYIIVGEWVDANPQVMRRGAPRQHPFDNRYAWHHKHDNGKDYWFPNKEACEAFMQKPQG